MSSGGPPRSPRSVSLAGRGSVGAPKSTLRDSWQKKTSDDAGSGPALKPWQQGPAKKPWEQTAPVRKPWEKKEPTSGRRPWERDQPAPKPVGSIASRFGGTGNGAASKFGPSKFGANRSGSNTPPSKEGSPATSTPISPGASEVTSPSASKTASPSTSKVASPNTSKTASPSLSKRTIPVKVTPVSSPKSSPVTLRKSPKASPKTGRKSPPKTSPKASPKTGRKSPPKDSPITASPSLSKRTIPVKVTPVSSPKSSPVVMRRSPKASPKIGRKSPPKTSPKTERKTPPNDAPKAAPKASPFKKPGGASRFAALKSKGFKGIMKDVGLLKQRIERVKEFVNKHNKISDIQKEMLINAINNESYTCRDLQLVIFAGPDLQAKFTLPGKDPSNPKALHKSTKQFISLAVSKLKFPQVVKDKLAQAIADDNCEIGLSKITILIKSGASTQNITLNLPGVLYPQIILRESNIATSSLIEVVDKFADQKEMTVDERNSVLTSIYNNNYVLDGRRLSVLVKDGDKRASVDFDIDPAALEGKPDQKPAGSSMPYFYVPEDASDEDIKNIMERTLSNSAIDADSMKAAIKNVKRGRFRREGSKILIEGLKRDSLTSEEDDDEEPRELAVKVLTKVEEEPKPFTASIEATKMEPQNLNELESIKFPVSSPLSSEMIRVKHQIIKVITMLTIEDRVKIELINKLIDDDFTTEGNTITIKSAALTMMFKIENYEITDVKIAYPNTVNVCKYIPIRIVILGTDAIKQSKFNDEKKKLLVEKFYSGDYVHDTFRGSVKISITYNRIPVRFSFGIPKLDATIPDIPKDELKVKVISDLRTGDLTQAEQDQVLQSLLDEDYTLIDTDVVFKIGVPVRSYRVRLVRDSASSTNTINSPAIGTPTPEVISREDTVVLEEKGPSTFDQQRPIDDALREKLNAVIKKSDFDEETKAILMAQLEKLTYFTGDTLTIESKKSDGTPVRFTINCKFTHEVVFVDSEEDSQKNKKAKTDETPAEGKVPITEEMRSYFIDCVKSSQFDQETKDLLINEINSLSYFTGDVVELNISKKDGTPVKLTLNYSTSDVPPSTCEKRVPSPVDSPAKKAKMPDKIPSEKAPEMEEEDVPMEVEDAVEVDEDIPMQEAGKVATSESAPDAPVTEEDVPMSEEIVAPETDEGIPVLDESKVKENQSQPEIDQPAVSHLDDVSVTRKLTSPESDLSKSIPVTDDIRNQLMQSIDASNLDDETKSLLKDEISKLDVLDGDTVKLNANKKDGTPIELTINIKNIVETATKSQKQPVSESPGETPEVEKEPTMEEEDVPMSEEEAAPEAVEDIPMQEEQKIQTKESAPEGPIDAEQTTVAHLDDVSVTSKLAPGMEPPATIPMTDDIRKQLSQSIDGSNLDDETKDLLKEEVNKLVSLEGDSIELKTAKKDETPIELTINIKNFIEASQPQKAEPEVADIEDDIAPMTEELPSLEAEKVTENESQPSPQEETVESTTNLDDVSVTRKLSSPDSDAKKSLPVTDDIRDQLIQSIRASDLDDETKKLLEDEVKKLKVLEGDTIKLSTAKKDGTPVELTINIKHIMEAVESEDDSKPIPEVVVEPSTPVDSQPKILGSKPEEESKSLPITDDLKDKLIESVKASALDEESVNLLVDEIKNLKTLEGDTMTLRATKKDGSPVELTININQIIKPCDEDSSDDEQKGNAIEHLGDVCLLVAPLTPSERRVSTPVTDELRAKILESLKCGNLDSETVEILTKEIERLEEIEGDQLKLKSEKPDGSPVELTINVRNILLSDTTSEQVRVELEKPILIYPVKISQDITVEDAPGSITDVTEEVREQIKSFLPYCDIDAETVKLLSDCVDKLDKLEGDVVKINAFKENGTPVELSLNIKLVPEEAITGNKDTVSSPPEITKNDNAPKKVMVKPMKLIEVEPIKLNEAVKVMPSDDVTKSVATPLTDDMRAQIVASLQEGSVDEDTIALIVDDLKNREVLEGDSVTLNVKKPDGTPVELTINIKHVRQLFPAVAPSDEGDNVAEKILVEPAKPMEVARLKVKPGEDVEASTTPSVPMTEEIKKQILESLKGANLDDETFELLSEQIDKVEKLEGDKMQLTATKKDGTPIDLTINISHITNIVSPESSDDGFEMVEKPMDVNEGYELVDAENKSASPTLVEEALMEEVLPEESVIEDITVAKDVVEVVEEIPEVGEQKKVPMTDDIKSQIMDSLKGANLDEETLELLEKEVDKLDTLEGDQIKLDTKKEDGTPITLTINISHIIRNIAPVPIVNEEGYELVEAAEEPKQFRAAVEVEGEDIPAEIKEKEPPVIEKPGEQAELEKIPVTDDIKSQIMDSLKGGSLDDETLDLLEKEVDKLDFLEGDQIKLDTKKKDGTPILLTVNIKNIVKNIVPVPMEEEEGYELIEKPPMAVQCDLTVPLVNPTDASIIPVTNEIKSQIEDSLVSSGHDQETIDLLRKQLAELLNFESDVVKLQSCRKDGTPIDFTINIHRITKETVPVPSGDETATPEAKKIVPITVEIRAQIINSLKDSNLDDETLDILEKEIEKLENLEGDSITLNAAKKDGTPINLTINLEHITKLIAPVDEATEEKVEVDLPIALEDIVKEVKSVPIADEDYGYALEYPKTTEEETLPSSGTFLDVDSEVAEKIKEAITALDTPEPAKDNLIKELVSGNMMACGANGLIKTTMELIEPTTVLINLTLPEKPATISDIATSLSPSDGEGDGKGEAEEEEVEEIVESLEPGPLVEVVLDVLDYCNVDQDLQRDNIQKRTFTRWANVQLKPENVEIDDLYEDLKDGLKLIGLLENLSKKPIKKTQRVKMNIHKLQNLEYALRHLEKEGVKLVNISNEDILSGNHKLTLGLIWTIICRYQFENLSMGNVTGGKLKSLLLAKCNQSIMIGYPAAKAHNFTSSFQDGMAFCAMVAAHAPDLIDMEVVKGMEPISRHELAFKVAEERFEVHQLLEPSDTVNNPDEKSIMTYIAALTAKLPDLGVHVDVATVEDYANHARAVKQFLGDKKTSWDNDPLPVTVAGMKSMKLPPPNPGADSSAESIQAEIDALRSFGANQMPDKHKEIDLLAKAFKDLEGKTDPDALKIITEEALTPKDLSENFNVALNAKKGREQKLLNLLKKKENEGSDLEKISIDCDSVKEKLRQLAGEVTRGKENWPNSTQPEIKRDCDRIDGFIDVITADLDNISKKYNEVAEYATDTDTITPIAVKIDELNTEFEKIVEEYRAFISQHIKGSSSMKDSEDSLLNKIKDLSEKLDAKRTGLSNIQWTNDLAVLKSCLEDVDKIQADINILAADKNELKSKHESLVPSDPLYGKFDAVLARCIEKFDDTQKQADRSHHDLSILKKFLEGVFQELPWIKKQEQSEIKRRWHIVVDPSAMPPCSQVEYQAELAKLTQHESSITQLIKVAKNLIKESPELDVLVQEPMFRLEVEWKRLYSLMQCCNTQLKIYEENLPFYRILNSISKNTNDINDLLLNPNKEDPAKYKQLLEQHNKNIEIGLNQLEKLDKYPTTGYFIDRSILPSDVNGLGDVYLRGEKILRPGDTTQITRVGDNLVCEVKLGSGKKELLPIVYFTRPYDPPILKKFIIHHKQRVEEINVKVEALTKDLISQKIFEEMEAVLMWDDIPDDMSEDEIARIKADCEAAIHASQERGDNETAEALKIKLNLLINHTDDLLEKATLAKNVGAEMEALEGDIKVEMDWCHTTEKTIDDMLVKVPPKEKNEIELNVRIYDINIYQELASQFPGHEIKQKEIVVSWQNIKDKNIKLEKDLEPEISEMQDIMRNIKKKKNDLYDKTTIEFVDHEMKPLEAWVDVARKRVDQIDVDGDLPKLQKIIAEVNLFLEDMKEKEKDMDRLNSKWEEGVNLGIENPDIERRITKLNSDWDELCDLTEAKSTTANTALQNMEDYDKDWNDQKAALESVDIWITEKKDVLKEFAEIPMDREKLDMMLGGHEVTIRDIEDKKLSIEAILEKGGLIVEALKHPATKKAASDKLNDLEKNYRDLEINCSAITRKLKDALGDMSDLDDRLREVVRWEDESKDYIQKQEPVSEDPDKLKEQIANLCEFKEAVNEMRPEIDYVQNQGKSCLDKYGDKDSKMKELKMILANVNVNWEFIETWLKNRENELNAAKKRNIDKLFADIEAMINWLGQLKDLLNDNQVKSMININPIIEIIHKVQGELDEKKPHYLMLCDASAKEVPQLEEPVCFELEAKTDKMKKLWNELCLDCEVQTRDIEDFVNKSAEVDESLDNLLKWANVKYGDLVKLEEVKPEELSKLLKPHEEDVNHKAPEVVGKLADVEQLLGPVADRDTEDLEVLALINKHDALANKWQEIQDELERLRKRANEYTDQESWFLDICLKMDKWLQIKKRILLGQPVVTMESFADDLKYHRDLLTEYEAKQIEFNRIWEISANIIKAVADQKKKAKLNLIRNKLADLWEEVYGLCMRRHYQFIEILKEIYRLEFRLVLTVEWLVETHYRLKHKPNGDFVQDIAFLKEIEANQKYVHQTFEDGRRVLRCVKSGQLPASELPRKDTLPNIEKHLIDLHNHWERLLAEIVLEKQRIDQVMAPLENHAYRMDKLLAWLLAEQVKVEKDAHLGGTTKQLLKQLNAVKQLEVDLNNNRDRLKNLNEEGYKNLYNAGVTDDFLKTHGACLVRSCPQIDDNVTYIAAMNTTWKHLECHVREKKMRLEDLTDRMEKFDKLLQAQHHWLNQCTEKIGKTQTDTIGGHENEGIITELQTLHAQLLATNKIGLLLIHQHGECVLPTIGKILDLQMHFDNTCSEAHAKHCHIDKSQLQLKLFRDSLEGMLAWLHKQRKAVDEKCRLVGSDGKLDELIEWHRKTKQDIDTHRGVRDSILLISDRFIKELGHTEISQLKTSVSELKDGFSNLEISFKKFSGSLGV